MAFTTTGQSYTEARHPHHPCRWQHRRARKAGTHTATPHDNNVMQNKLALLTRDGLKPLSASSSSASSTFPGKSTNIYANSSASMAATPTPPREQSAISKQDMPLLTSSLALLTRSGLKPLHIASSSSASSQAVPSMYSFSSSSSTSSLSKLEDTSFLHSQFCAFPCQHTTGCASLDTLLDYNLPDDLYPDYNGNITVGGLIQEEQAPWYMGEPPLHDRCTADLERRSDDETLFSIDLGLRGKYVLDEISWGEEEEEQEEAKYDADSKRGWDEESLFSINLEQQAECYLNQGQAEEQEKEKHDVQAAGAPGSEAEESFSFFKFQFHELYSPGFEEYRQKACGPAYPPDAFIPYSLF